MKKIKIFEDGTVATFEETEGFHVDVDRRSLDSKVPHPNNEPIAIIDNPTDQEFMTAKDTPNKIKFNKKTGKLQLLTD